MSAEAIAAGVTSAVTAGFFGFLGVSVTANVAFYNTTGVMFLLASVLLVSAGWRDVL